MIALICFVLAVLASTAEWVARQMTEAFPWDEAPRYVIRDRDRIYGTVVARPTSRNEHPRQANCTSLTLAEWLCRTVDRINPARVLGPRYCFERGTSTPDSKIIRRLLQLRQNASVFAQGCADFSSDSSDRKRSFTPDPRRASPSLRPGLSFRYTQPHLRLRLGAAKIVERARRLLWSGTGCRGSPA